MFMKGVNPTTQFFLALLHFIIINELCSYILADLNHCKQYSAYITNYKLCISANTHSNVMGKAPKYCSDQNGYLATGETSGKLRNLK